jgi:hypothetical protein
MGVIVHGQVWDVIQEGKAYAAPKPCRTYAGI